MIVLMPSTGGANGHTLGWFDDVHTLWHAWRSRDKQGDFETTYRDFREYAESLLGRMTWAVNL